jgi:Putative lumazine-binding
MVMRLLVILLVSFGLIGSATAKTNERAAVIAAVDRFLHAVNTDDPAALKATQLPEGMTFALIYGSDGAMKLRPRSNAEWAERAGKSKAKLNERYWSPKVMIHRDMAVFWAPYSFDIDGKRSHCGIDVFELVKVEGQWKIANAMWTIEPDGCSRS